MQHPIQPPIHLALIYGSARDGRLCDTVAQWAERRIAAAGGFTVDAIDPATPEVAAGIDGRDEAAAAALRRRLDRAEAFVVVTPEYNHSYPAPLKALIDSAKTEWAAKPVAFVSYGGASGGIRAVEHLRLVFAELHAVGIRDGVIFPSVWEQFDVSGEPHQAARAERAAATMLGRLAWWARTLTQGRESQTYAEAA